MESSISWISRGLRLAGLALSVGFVGCGSGAFGEDTGETSEAVAPAATNISDGLITNSMAQSETAAVGLGGTVMAVAYNSGSSAPHVGERCLGYSQLGMSYNSNGAWRAIHFAVPSGISALRGDPSIAALDNGSDWRVFVSSIAHSTDVWNVTPKQPDGCITLASYGNLGVDRLCLITVSVPKNGSAASVVANGCVTGGSFDGTAATVISGTPYFSSWSNDISVRFFRGTDCAEMAAPLTSVGGIEGHPQIMKGSPSTLVAPTSSGNFYMTNFTPNGGIGTWDTPIFMGSGFNFEQSLPFGIRHGKEYASVFVPCNGPCPGAAWLFYLQADARIVGNVWQAGTLSQGVWHSRSGLSAFHPAVEVATTPNPPFAIYNGMLSYFDNGGNYGRAELNFAWTGTNQNAFMMTEETPCTFMGYWGDYDEMAVQNNLTGNPTFVRAFTDSTAVACNPGSDYDNTKIPMHVSIIGRGKF